MITYDGIKFEKTFAFILFKNENDKQIKIPISKDSAQVISMQLEKLSTVERKIVDRGNDEPAS